MGGLGDSFYIAFIIFFFSCARLDKCCAIVSCPPVSICYVISAAEEKDRP